jgi:predicted class III extradiol MEMO1 family dioxygenase
VERLDAMAMESIETLDPQKFAAYMSEYKNSICGRNVIGILLNVRVTFDVSVIDF